MKKDVEEGAGGGTGVDDVSGEVACWKCNEVEPLNYNTPTLCADIYVLRKKTLLRNTPKKTLKKGWNTNPRIVENGPRNMGIL